MPVSRNAAIGVAVAAAVAIGGVAAAVAVGSGGGGSSGGKGITRGPGTEAPAPTSDDGGAGGGAGGGGGGGNATPQVPHNHIANIYNVFGANPAEASTLAGIAQDLQSEGYDVTTYADTNEGANSGAHGGATLANFVGMARRASVIVLNTHGSDFANNNQACPTAGNKGLYFCRPVQEPSGAPAPSPRVIAPQALVPVMQVEWYHTWAGERSALARYVAQGYDRSWLFDPSSPRGGPMFADTLTRWHQGEKGLAFVAEGPAQYYKIVRPWLGITATGIAHFFKGREIDLFDNLACHSLPFAPQFDTRSYFGHAKTSCSGLTQQDDPTLFDRLIGKAGVPARTTTGAMALGGFEDQYFRLSADSEPVVLSPAVESVDPPDTSRVAAGKTTTVTVKFDAVMDAGNADKVVTVNGCGATISNPEWSGKDTLTLDLAVPKKPPNTTATFTVHHEEAIAPGEGDNQILDGNTNPSGESGLAPNVDDFTWKVSCDSFSVPPPPTTTAPPGRCNPGDVELRVHLYGHVDIEMSYTDSTSSAKQTSWPAGNAPFPNSFPKYPAPYLRYGCFLKDTHVHLTFRNSDEPWLLLDRTIGPGCNRSKALVPRQQLHAGRALRADRLRHRDDDRHGHQRILGRADVRRFHVDRLRQIPELPGERARPLLPTGQLIAG